MVLRVVHPSSETQSVFNSFLFSTPSQPAIIFCELSPNHPFFLSQIHSPTHIAFIYPISSSPPIYSSLSGFLRLWWTWYLRSVLASYFVQCPWFLVCLQTFVSSWINTNLCFLFVCFVLFAKIPQPWYFCPSSCVISQGTWCQYVLPLTMLTSITCLRWCLPGVVSSL